MEDSRNEETPFRDQTTRVFIPGYMRSDLASHLAMIQAIMRGQFHCAMVTLLMMKEYIPSVIL